MMFMECTCREFANRLASAEPTPGGGGASALAGALGAALGSMVGNLTVGKKKYENVREDVERILKKAAALQEELLALAEKDAEVFAPLAEAYRLPQDTEEEKKKKDEVMEKALKLACTVPMEIMEKAIEAIDLHEELSEKGAKIAISDVGVGVQFCRAALLGASLNVFINTKLMKDRDYAEKLNAKADAMLRDGVEKADAVYGRVEAALGRGIQ